MFEVLFTSFACLFFRRRSSFVHLARKGRWKVTRCAERKKRSPSWCKHCG